MGRMGRFACIGVLAGTFLATPAFAQGQAIDLAGQWSARVHEDAVYRGAGGLLGDYTGLPITDVQFHPLFMQDAQHEAVLRSGARLSFFWFSTTTEVFAAIRKFQPFAVDTSEARLMRRWLER